MARAWGVDQEREAFQRKVSAWKAAEPKGPNPTYPLGHPDAGKPQELTLVTMHLDQENGRQIGYFEVRPETNPVDLVKDIFDTAQDHARSTKSWHQTRVCLFHFGDQKRHTSELGVPTYPDEEVVTGFPSGFAGGSNRGDLTIRGNQEAVALQYLLQANTRTTEIIAAQGNTIMEAASRLMDQQGRMFDRQAGMLEKALTRVDKIEDRYDKLQEREESVRNAELDRTIKLQNAEIMMMFKRAGVEHFFSVVPAIMSVAYRKLAAKMGLETSPIEERVFKIADMIFKTPEKMAAVMKDMEPADQQALITLVQEANKQREMKLYFERGKAITGGVTRPMALAKWVQTFGVPGAGAGSQAPPAQTQDGGVQKVG